MVKKIVSISIVGCLMSLLLFVIIKGTGGKQKAVLDKPATSKFLTTPYFKVEKPEPDEDRYKSKTSQASELLSYLDEFNIPKKIKDELKVSIESGSLDEGWANSVVSREELQEVGLGLNQLAKTSLDKARRNVSAGHKVSNKTFDKVLEVFLSDQAVESEQIKDLQSEALVDLAFSAFENFEFEKAEKAFKVVVEKYPESDSAPIVYLEYARLLLEQGRLFEARSLIDEAVNKYSADKEFISLVQTLEEAIDSYE